MKKLFLILSVIFTTAIYSQTKVEKVDAITFKKYIDEKKGILIDLRTDDELARKGFIKGSKQLDFFGKNAEAVIKKLDKKKTYLIYCAGGGRSGDCADLMTKLNFTHVVDLTKGFEDWKKLGFEIETKK